MFFHYCTACHKSMRPDICLLYLTTQVLNTCKKFLKFLYNSACNEQKKFSQFTSGRSRNTKKWHKRAHYPRSRRRRSMKFWVYEIPVETHTDTKNHKNPYTNKRAACKKTLIVCHSVFLELLRSQLRARASPKPCDYVFFRQNQSEPVWYLAHKLAR